HVRLHLGAFADDQLVAGDDLAGELAVDADGALEDQLAFELAALAQERVQLRLARDGGQRRDVGGNRAVLGGSGVLYHVRVVLSLRGSLTSTSWRPGLFERGR